jgi:hypothetical protein
MFLLIILTFFSNPAQAQSRKTLPNDFGAELLGKAVIYNFSYQRMLNPWVGLQGGIEAFGAGSEEGSTNILFFPVGGNFYLIPKDGSMFLTGGIVFLTASSDEGPIDSGTYSYTGLGFEYRATGGFIFRGTIYGLISGGNYVLWPGIHIGYAF